MLDARELELACIIQNFEGGTPTILCHVIEHMHTCTVRSPMLESCVRVIVESCVRDMVALASMHACQLFSLHSYIVPESWIISKLVRIDLTIMEKRRKHVCGCMNGI